MRSILLSVLLLSVISCARVAAPTAFGKAAPQFARVQLQVGDAASAVTVPANVPHAVSFCDPADSWTRARWYLVKIDGVDQAWAGALEPEQTEAGTSTTCWRTPKTYAFATGAHTMDVSLVNHCDAGDTDVKCHTDQCSAGCDVYGSSTMLSVTANSTALLVGPPPAISNGQVLR